MTGDDLKDSIYQMMLEAFGLDDFTFTENSFFASSEENPEMFVYLEFKNGIVTKLDFNLPLDGEELTTLNMTLITREELPYHNFIEDIEYDLQTAGTITYLEMNFTSEDWISHASIDYGDGTIKTTLEGQFGSPTEIIGYDNAPEFTLRAIYFYNDSIPVNTLIEITIKIIDMNYDQVTVTITGMISPIYDEFQWVNKENNYSVISEDKLTPTHNRSIHEAHENVPYDPNYMFLYNVINTTTELADPSNTESTANYYRYITNNDSLIEIDGAFGVMQALNASVEKYDDEEWVSSVDILTRLFREEEYDDSFMYVSILREGLLSEFGLGFFLPFFFPTDSMNYVPIEMYVKQLALSFQFQQINYTLDFTENNGRSSIDFFVDMGEGHNLTVSIEFTENIMSDLILVYYDVSEGLKQQFEYQYVDLAVSFEESVYNDEDGIFEGMDVHMNFDITNFGDMSGKYQFIFTLPTYSPDHSSAYSFPTEAFTITPDEVFIVSLADFNVSLRDILDELVFDPTLEDTITLHLKVTFIDGSGRIRTMVHSVDLNVPLSDFVPTDDPWFPTWLKYTLLGAGGIAVTIWILGRFDLNPLKLIGMSNLKKGITFDQNPKKFCDINQHDPRCHDYFK